ncbi:hypothetical protein GCM10007385_40160 [Tateyamaria omphalii]|uniref:serine hydrolase domain-containing protein n=1 Tax=Tateyamaria omphalii TaxID=299262 RepID=UPI001672159B|nr:serine hydrolase domain-containing protein [Tateyamaria omphalii]GGX67059.1 hypothetical protein GCM10007385_40160 [Tateyamaria omphalii]
MIHQLRQSALSVVRRLLLITLVCASSKGVASPDGHWHETLNGFADGLITTGLDQDAVAGAVLVVVSGNDVILSRGYRLSDARTGRIMTTDTDIIPLASVTKVFTALAILQLAEDGRLSLDDPIARHLPGLELAQKYGDISIAHLLSHAGGLEERYSGYFAEHDTTTAVEHISSVLPRQVRPPGDAIAYSNASYVLLGEIISQTSGQPFERYITDTILSPLGIETSRFMHEPSEIRGTSPFHVWDAGRYVAIDAAPFPAIHLSSGGLALSADAMGHVMQRLLDLKAQDGPLSSAAIGNMYRPAWPDSPQFSGRTLGFWTEKWAGHTVYHHGGTHFGFHTNMVLVPSLDLGFFIAANGRSGSALMGLPRRAIREVIAPDERPKAARSECTAECLDEYTGRFITTRRNKTGLDRLHAPNAHKMGVQTTENDALLMSGLGFSRLFHATGPDQFETPEGDFWLGFSRNASGEVTKAYLSGGMHTFDRMTFWDDVGSLHSALWTALAGALMCLIGAMGTWRSRRRVVGMPVSMSISWFAGSAICTAILAWVWHGSNLSAQPSAGLELWSLTGLYAVGLVSLPVAAFWALRLARSSDTARIEQLAVLAALPLFSWALLAAWKWNLPTAALTW